MKKQKSFPLWERVASASDLRSDLRLRDEAGKKLRSLPADLPSSLAETVYDVFLREASHYVWGALARVRRTHADAVIAILSRSDDLPARFLCSAYEAGGVDDLRLASKYLAHADKSTNVPGMLKRIGKFFDPIGPDQGVGFYSAAQVVISEKEKPGQYVLYYWAILWLFIYTTDDEEKLAIVRERVVQWDLGDLWTKTAASVTAF